MLGSKDIMQVKFSESLDVQSKCNIDAACSAFGLFDIVKDDDGFFIFSIEATMCNMCIMEQLFKNLKIDIGIDDDCSCIWFCNNSIVLDKNNGIEIYFMNGGKSINLHVPSDSVELEFENGDLMYTREEDYSNCSSAERMFIETQWIEFRESLFKVLN